jgi:hypothetical protein
VQHRKTHAHALDGYVQHAILTASLWQHFGCVQLLIETGISLDHLKYAAKAASDRGFTDVVDMLLAKGAVLSGE